MTSSLRILAVSPRLYLGDMYLSLLREGHQLRVAASDPPEQRAFGGLIDPVDDWRSLLPWVGRDGLIMFEGVASGAVQDHLRAEGYRVIGGSALGDRLETDRAFGQAVLAEAGLPMAQSQAFERVEDAAAWLQAHPAQYVLKYDRGTHTTYVGEHPAGEDVLFMLRRNRSGDVLLMERLRGVEVGIGAYFDGRQFLRPACIDFEHKRFFNGDRGEMTGEMGTLASYEGAGRLFEATLNRVAPVLAGAGHIGYVNLNLIVNERGPLPLEFTCRFGNPGFAILAAMQPDGWADLLDRMARGAGGQFRTTPGWAVAIVLTVPPFPATAPINPAEDAPVFFLAPPSEAELPSYHYVDMRQEAGQLLVRRCSGHAMIVTGTGPNVAEAQAEARRRALNVVAPELRWRDDIGARFLAGEEHTLQQLGWL